MIKTRDAPAIPDSVDEYGNDVSEDIVRCHYGACCGEWRPEYRLHRSMRTVEPVSRT